ncbi:MAG: hypothetical protein AB7K52_11870 [Phycisphaerales bacterium]
MNRTPGFLALCASLAALHAASGQTTMPSEFETPGTMLRRAFTYFGGVASASVTHSPDTVFSGSSMQVTINFQPDAFFLIAGAGFQSDIMSPPALAIAPGADTFSLTVNAPVSDRLVVFVRVREDDNADGIIDTAGDDDQWESVPFLLQAGSNSINLPFSSFQVTNPGVGNEQQNFLTTPLMRYYLVFETRSTLPGGILQSPVTLGVDHVGFYVGPQSPAPSCAADFNADGELNPDDLGDYINCYFSVPACIDADFNADANVDADDLGDFINAYFAGCA